MKLSEYMKEPAPTPIKTPKRRKVSTKGKKPGRGKATSEKKMSPRTKRRWKKKIRTSYGTWEERV